MGVILFPKKQRLSRRTKRGTVSLKCPGKKAPNRYVTFLHLPGDEGEEGEEEEEEGGGQGQQAAGAAGEAAGPGIKKSISKKVTKHVHESIHGGRKQRA